MSKKELLNPQMIRLTERLKKTIQKSANKHNEGNFNREVRSLIQIGLQNRKIEGKK